MEKLCLIFNLAPKYRENIYKRIDDCYNCHWYFGTNNTDIKGFNLHILKNAQEVRTVKLLGQWTWRTNTVELLSKYNVFITIGDVYCLSTWVLSILSLFFRDKKVYFWSHGWYGKECFIKKILKKFFLKLPNGILLYGNYAKTLMIKEGFDENKLFVIHNSLNYDKQIEIRNRIKPSNIYTEHFKNKFNTLIFIGRLTRVKKINMLFDAVVRLKQKGHFYNIVLVGIGGEYENLKQIAKDNDIPVWFYGECYDEVQNAELIYNADLCVAPGNVGLTAIHSMMFGTPVITHNSFKDQMPEFESIIDGVTGAFYDYNNSISLSDSIYDWFVKHKNERDAVRQSCYHEIDTNWTPQYQLEVIKKLFELDNKI